MAKLAVKRVVGNTILLKVTVEDSDKMLKSDTILIPREIENEQKERALFSTEIGEVKQLGDLAFIKFHDELPCHVGDKVMIVPNTGYLFHDSVRDTWFRIVKDVDIIAVLEKGEK